MVKLNQDKKKTIEKIKADQLEAEDDLENLRILLDKLPTQKQHLQDTV